MRRLLAHGLVVLSLAALASALGVGCSDQGEGERCSTQNNNDDCTSGTLVCVTAASLGKSENFDRCCPPDPTQVTTSACTPTTNLPIGEAGAPDASGADSSVVDSSVQDSVAPDTSVVDANTPSDAATEGG